MFRLCHELGIDDPIAWFKAVPETVLDQWKAYYLWKAEPAQDSPEAAREKLNGSQYPNRSPTL